MHDQSKPLNPDSAPTETQEAPQAPGKRVSIWVKAWVIFHCVAIFVWATPNPPQGYSPQNPWALRTDGFQNFAQSLNDGYRVFTRDVLKNSPIKQYVQCTSFWQYWDMFAPNPADTDCYGDAIVEYKDGSHYLYAYPRMHDLNLFDRYVNERYRKFFERACTQEFGYTWTQFGQYVALRCYHDPKTRPSKSRCASTVSGSCQLTNGRRPNTPPRNIF